jgi:multiple antibiotic resistance protein
MLLGKLAKLKAMHLVDFIKTMLMVFVPLFPVVNPIGDAPIFLALTQQYPDSVRKVLARKIAAYGFALLAGSFLFGSLILDFFGISIPVIQLAGGLVVAATGWSLLNQKDDDDAEQSPATLDDAMEHAFYPLTLPITVGPGCISIAITWVHTFAMRPARALNTASRATFLRRSQGCFCYVCW